MLRTISFFFLFLKSLSALNSSDHSPASRHSHLHSSHHSLLEKGKCRSHVWRIDEAAPLPGKCTGINPTTDYEDLKHLQITNWLECRALCCNLNEKCVTWQYQNQTKTCYLHPKPFRRGPEGAPTPLYCDPYPTHKWNGKYLKSRNEQQGQQSQSQQQQQQYQCEWAYELPAQCFAFGPERLNNNGVISMEKGERMNTQECEQACCNDVTCNSWQEYPGRGCYYGVSNCKFQEVEGVFEGGRKCLPEFCGNLEKEVLLPEQFLQLQKLAETIKNSN